MIINQANSPCLVTVPVTAIVNVTVIQIHARIHRCWRVVCNCGVAIREGNDVIKIDKCGGVPVVQQLSPEPLNGRVRVKRRNLGGSTEFRVSSFID